MNLESAIYIGRVRHRRFKPTGNAFSYSICLFYLDLSELPLIFKRPGLCALNGPGLVAFRRKDYLGSVNEPLDKCVRDLVQKETGHRPQGPIRMLTQISYLGYCFNPVTFYYCFDATGKRVAHIVTEITNTPWHERHAYVLTCHQKRSIERFSFSKEFHVSPFMPMDLSYEWMFSNPSEKLLVHMKNSTEAEAPHFFDASLTLERRTLSSFHMLTATLLYPLMTFKTVVLIYFQALKLWIKRVPFHTHPSKGVSDELDINRPASH